MKSTDKWSASEGADGDDQRLFSPSAARNRDPIRDVLVKTLPATGAILELGSGTGEHAVHVASSLPHATWLPGDPDAASRASIVAHTRHAALQNVAPPHRIDATEEWWTALDRPIDAIVSINMIHIAPFDTARGLFAGAGRVLPAGGLLCLYGPFAVSGAHTAPSNEAFDVSLKARDPRWGVRDLEHDLAPLAQENALRRTALVEMPANNHVVVYAKHEEAQ